MDIFKNHRLINDTILEFEKHCVYNNAKMACKENNVRNRLITSIPKSD